MRSWIFHPIIFYPLVIALAVLVVGISIEPQKWPRPAEATAVEHAGASLVWANAAFSTPDVDAGQHIRVERDLFGHAQALHIAVLPNQPPPTPADRGVRLLLTPTDAAAIAGRPVTVEVSYHPLPINAATGLALSLQGGAPTQWVSHDAPSPPQGPLRFELPAQTDVSALGLRVISGGTDEAYGLEITGIRLTPHA